VPKHSHTSPARFSASGERHNRAAKIKPAAPGTSASKNAVRKEKTAASPSLPGRERIAKVLR
jgi:hypothetical protein